MTDRSLDLYGAIEASGYYPDVVSDAVRSAVAGEPVVSYLVHHEPTIDERDEVRRHVTVLVLTGSRLILAHTDEHDPDDLLPAPYTSTSTEAVMLAAVGRSWSTAWSPTRPPTTGGASRRPAPTRRCSPSAGARWGASTWSRRLRDPDCEADHGYTGMVASDDFSLRVSSAAEGPEAVANLLTFADALSARTPATAATVPDDVRRPVVRRPLARGRAAGRRPRTRGRGGTARGRARAARRLRSYVVFLVDGLGYELLRDHADDAPFLHAPADGEPGPGARRGCPPRPPPASPRSARHCRPAATGSSGSPRASPGPTTCSTRWRGTGTSTRPPVAAAPDRARAARRRPGCTPRWSTSASSPARG